MKKLIIFLAFCLVSIAAFAQSYVPDGRNLNFTGFVKMPDAKFKVGTVGLSGDEITAMKNLVTSFSSAIQIGTVVVLDADSVSPTSGSYTSRYDFENELPSTDFLFAIKAMGSNVKGIPVIPLLPTNYTELLDSTLMITAVSLGKSELITGVHVQAGNVTGNYVASSTGFNGVSLYYSNGTSLIKVAESANTKNNWTEQAYYGKDIPFTTPYLAAAGVWYVVIQYNMNSTTVIPKLMTTTTFNAGYAGSFHTGGLATPLILTATKSATATLQSTITISTLTGANYAFYPTLY